MATMTISEAEHILDVVSEALQSSDHRHTPLSALEGYDIYEICKALKLRIANEFLTLAGRSDAEERFAEGLEVYGGIPGAIWLTVVPDDQVNTVGAKPVFFPLDFETGEFVDERMAADETPSSFGEFCQAVGTDDLLFWQKVYTRLDLEYTTTAPQRNYPIKLTSSVHPTGQPRSSDPEKDPANSIDFFFKYLAATGATGVVTGVISGVWMVLGIVFAEIANGILSLTQSSIRVRYGVAFAIVLPLFVYWTFALAPDESQVLSRFSKVGQWAFSFVVAGSILVVAIAARRLAQLAISFEIPIVATFIVFCFFELHGLRAAMLKFDDEGNLG